MELKQLRYFTAVAEELHFGRAASRLHISQPAVSFDIKKLEEQLGTPLFTRYNKRIELTTAGKLLLTEARKLLRYANEAQQLIKRSSQGTEGLLRIGFVNSMLIRGLPLALKRFSQLYPKVEIIAREMNSQEQLAALEGHSIDLGCTHTVRHSDQLHSHPLLSEPFDCCLAKDHPLATTDSIDLARLADEPFICFPRDVSPQYHDQIVAVCMQAGFSPTIRHEIRFWQTAVSMVEFGMGVALVPRSINRHYAASLHTARIEGPAGTSTLQLLFRKGQQDNVNHQFATLLEQVVHEQTGYAPARSGDKGI